MFFGIQLFYEIVFVTKNFNKYIIKTNENLTDYDFIFDLDKSKGSIQFQGIVYHNKLINNSTKKWDSKLETFNQENWLIFKPFMDEEITPNLFDKTRGSKEEYIEYISSSMGVKRKDFEKAISKPWKSKILSYVGNYCPND